MSDSARSSFDFLFRRHRQELLAFAGQRSSQEVAEDLVQEAYLRFIQQAGSTVIDNPRAYLYRIIHNLAADYLRQLHVRSRYDGELDELSVVDPKPKPDAAADTRQRWQLCLQALEGLPEVYRHVLLLHRFDGMTYAEIGKALGLPTRTVERYAAKAVARCLAVIDQDGSH